MATRELAARASLTVSAPTAPGAPGGRAVAGSGPLGAAPVGASLFGTGLLACICAWCSRWDRGPA